MLNAHRDWRSHSLHCCKCSCRFRFGIQSSRCFGNTAINHIYVASAVPLNFQRALTQCFPACDVPSPAPCPFRVYAKPKHCSRGTSHTQARQASCSIFSYHKMCPALIQSEEDTKLMVFYKIIHSNTETPLCS